MVGISAAPRLAAGALALLLGLLVFTAPAAGAAPVTGEWRVPEAALRYKLTIYLRPSHPSAGYYVHLPDGGLLRNAIPSTTVVTDAGKEVPSFLLWQNPETGFSLVFADP